MANGSDVTEPLSTAFNDVQKGLAWFVVVAFVTLIFVWVFKPPVMAPESMAQLNQLVSTLQNILLLAVGFFFGSSKGAQNKDEVQAKVAEKLAEKGGNVTMEQAMAAAQLAAGPAALAAATETVPPVVGEVVPPVVQEEIKAALGARDAAEQGKKE